MMTALSPIAVHIFQLKQGQVFRLARAGWAELYRVETVDDHGWSFIDSLGHPVSAMALFVLNGGLFVYPILETTEA